MNDSDDGTLDTNRTPKKNIAHDRKSPFGKSAEKAKICVSESTPNGADTFARKLRSGELSFCQAYFGYLKAI